MKKSFATHFLFATIASLHCVANADVIIPPQPANKVSAIVTSDVKKDPHTGIYTYSYTLENQNSAIQNIEFFAIELSEDTEILNITAPSGWSASHNENAVSDFHMGWGATASHATDSENQPSPASIPPGGRLSGFSIQTYTPPAKGKFFAQGFTPTPLAEDAEDFDEEGYEIKPWRENSATGNTDTRIEPAIYDGNRRPAVDGFVGFKNLQAGTNSISLPAEILIRFSLNNETVLANTFHASINGVDITEKFNYINAQEMNCSLSSQDSFLRNGRNTLEVSISGYRNGGNKIAKDIDRIILDLETTNTTQETHKTTFQFNDKK